MRTVGMRFLPLFAMAAISATSQATLLDFNTLTGSDQDYYYDFQSGISTGGYLLTATDLVSWKPGLGLATCGGNYTGTTALFSNFRDDTVTLARASGTFNLVSMDIANLFLQNGGPFPQTTSTIVFTGYYAGGGTVTRSYTTVADNDLHTVSFAGFTNLSSVTWSQDGIPYHQFDNIVVTPQAVPEPASMAAVAIGLIGVARRRRK